MRRLSALSVLLVLTALTLAGPLARGAGATGYDTGAEGVFINGVNSARSQAGVGGIRVSADLVAIARRHSAEMASKGQLYHNANLGSEVTGWQAIAENVGDGTSAPYVNNLFMQSAAHHKNMVDPRWVDMGIGVVWSGDHLYVTEVFRQPAGASQPAPAAAPAPAPRPPAPTRRAPAPRAAPAPRPAAPPPPVVAPAPAPPPPPRITTLRIVSPTGVGDTVSPIVIRTIVAYASDGRHTPPPVSGTSVLVLMAVTLPLSIGLLVGRDVLVRSARARSEPAISPSAA